MPDFKIAGMSPPFAIISAEHEGLSEVAKRGHTAALHTILFSMTHYTFLLNDARAASGCWRGNCEASFLVSASDLCLDSNAFNALVDLAVKYDQECFMLVEADYSAHLYYPATDCMLKLDGTFGEITKELAEQYGSYTQVEGRYYGMLRIAGC